MKHHKITLYRKYFYPIPDSLRDRLVENVQLVVVLTGKAWDKDIYSPWKRQGSNSEKLEAAIASNL